VEERGTKGILIPDFGYGRGKTRQEGEEHRIVDNALFEAEEGGRNMVARS
jgi:hypothetical protein